MMPLRRRRSGGTDPEEFKGGVPAVPPEVVTAVRLGPGERDLAGAQDDHTGAWVVATTFRLLSVHEQSVELDRPWAEVDSGSWDSDTGTLGVSWVDAAPVRQWQLRTRTGPGRMPETLRERVSASVVLTRHIDLGPRRHARVVIRKDLATRQLLEQVLVSRDADRSDAELREAVRSARTQLRDQAGLPPAGTEPIG